MELFTKTNDKGVSVIYCFFPCIFFKKKKGIILTNPKFVPECTRCDLFLITIFSFVVLLIQPYLETMHWSRMEDEPVRDRKAIQDI